METITVRINKVSMEAKEKAEELMWKFMNNCQLDKPAAIDSALICVDEILNINKEIWDNLADSYFEYWLEVKQELTTLNQ